jgi:hypothetical protein
MTPGQILVPSVDDLHAHGLMTPRLMQAIGEINIAEMPPTTESQPIEPVQAAGRQPFQMTREVPGRTTRITTLSVRRRWPRCTD